MSCKLLVVDDSKLARIFVARALASVRPEWTIVEAADADEALSVARRAGPDAAVIDFNMPGRNGLSLAEDLRALHPQMPLAVISANFQNEIVSRARCIRAEFLPKPLKQDAFDVFIGRAEAAIGRHST